MPDAIFERRGDAFWATELASGPWNPDAQHGGAPAALLGGELERLEPRPELRIARITYELLPPVPLGELHVHTEIARPGRRVQLLEAALSAPDGTVLVRARALRVARAPVTAGTATDAVPPGPESAPDAGAPWNPRSLPGGAVELDWREWLYINPDLTVYIEREPRSEWVALQAHTRMLEGETALAQAVLFDTAGRIGRSLQSLYVAHR